MRTTKKPSQKTRKINDKSTPDASNTSASPTTRRMPPTSGWAPRIPQQNAGSKLSTPPRPKNTQTWPRDARTSDTLSPFLRLAPVNYMKTGNDQRTKRTLSRKEKRKRQSDEVIELTSSSEDENTTRVKRRKQTMQTTPTRSTKRVNAKDVIDLSDDEPSSGLSPSTILNRNEKLPERTPFTRRLTTKVNFTDNSTPPSEPTRKSISPASLKRKLARAKMFADDDSPSAINLPTVIIRHISGGNDQRVHNFPALVGSLTQRLFSQSFIPSENAQTTTRAIVSRPDHSRDETLQKCTEGSGGTLNIAVKGSRSAVQKQVLHLQAVQNEPSVPPVLKELTLADEIVPSFEHQTSAHELEINTLPRHTQTPEPAGIVHSSFSIPLNAEADIYPLLEHRAPAYAPKTSPSLRRTQTPDPADIGHSLPPTTPKVEASRLASSLPSFIYLDDSPRLTTPDSNLYLVPDAKLLVEVHDKDLAMPTIPPGTDDDDYLLSQGFSYPDFDNVS